MTQTTNQESNIKDVYDHHSNYDWYLKADVDTFIFMDNLRIFLNDTDSHELIRYGYNFVNKIRYHSGGAGYLVSQAGIQRLAAKLQRDIAFCSNRGIEDINVRKCLQKLNVKMGKSIDERGRERFHPLNKNV